MDERVTKKVEMTDKPNEPGYTETTSEALSSVEVGEDAKGTQYVKSSKSYHADPLKAAEESVAAFKAAKAALG